MSAPSETEGPDPIGAEGSPEPEPPAGPDCAGLADFLRSIAHDLRSPLGVVAEALRELSSDFAPDLTDDHRLLVALADRGLLRLGRIADAVSLVAALDSKDVVLARQQADLVEIVRGAATTAVAIEPRREVEIALELLEKPCPAEVDPGRLSRAIAEIVINAVRHAHRNVRIRLDLGAGEARVVVEDDGQGVAADRRATLFRRFAARPSRSGLGVGLSIANDLIVAHGGQIALDASTLVPGRPGTIGSRFVVSLPLGGAV